MLNMSTLYERLIEICRDQGIDTPIGRDIELVAGISSGRVTQIKQERDAARLGSKAIQKLTGMGYLADWLQDGRGPRRATQSTSAPSGSPQSDDSNTTLGPGPSQTENIPSDDEYALIPQYSAKGACGPAYHNGHVEVRGGLAFKRDWLARLGLRPENLSVIAASGESMAPTIQDGEVLLIDHSDAEPRDGKVFALARGDELVVKRLARDFAGGWIVRSDNPDKTRHGDMQVADTALRIVGRVVWRGGGL